MLERCQLAASEIASQEVLNNTTVTAAVNKLGNLRVSRILVTNQAGTCIYDSYPKIGTVGKYILLPEVMDALNGNDAFRWDYNDGTMLSRAACPIISYGTVIGSIYMVEYDVQQGRLMHSLQNNTLTISIALEIILIFFSVVFSKAFSGRIHRIMESIKIIRNGDYSKKLKVGGHDELTVLGDEFNDMVEKLRSSEDARRQFVSDASHELKTPLASIKLLSDSILQNELDIDTVREFVGDIGNEADRLNRMSQKLLSMSKAEAQEQSEFEITSIGPTMEKVSRMLSATSKEKDIEISVCIEKDCSILIMEDDLYQILFNLAENGIKYNRIGGKLTLSLARRTNYAVLKVSDTGVGIPAEAQERIFERFYRVDKARSRQSGGSGLGLAIVKTMVERNGGKISVSSVEDHGTTFTIVFPVFDMEEGK